MTGVQQAGVGVKHVEHLGPRQLLNRCSTGVQQVFNRTAARARRLVAGEGEGPQKVCGTVLQCYMSLLGVPCAVMMDVCACV